VTPVQSPERESVFDRTADWVSAAMGRPTNIIIWLILVVGWIVIFAFGGPHLASGSWMPNWFVSTGFNFPMNLSTTVAELFIGFLVAAAANRSERNLEATLAAIQASEDRDAAAIKLNAELSQRVEELTGEIRRLAAQMTTK
jgi:low affinity Fe/Cu permease